MQVTNVTQLKGPELKFYRRRRNEYGEKELIAKRDELGPFATLDSKTEKKLDRLALEDTIKEFNLKASKPIRRGRTIKSSRLTGKGAKLGALARAAVAEKKEFEKGKEKERDNARPPEDKQTEKPLPSLPSLPDEEIMFVPSSEIHSGKESSTLTSFSDKLSEVIYSLKTNEAMTEGKENPFYPTLEKWKQILIGFVNDEGERTKGVQECLFELQKLKNTLEVLHQAVIDSSKYKPDILTLLEQSWSKHKELSDFFTSNKETTWSPIHKQLVETRNNSTPLRFSAHFAQTKTKVSEQTSSQRPGDTEKTAEYMKKVDDCLKVRDVNYRLSLFCNELLKAFKERMDWRIAEISDLLSKKNIKKLQVMANNPDDGQEHILTINNKQGVIQKQQEYISQVLEFKETLDVLMNALYQIPVDEQKYYVPILECYKEVFEKTAADLIKAEKEIKSRVQVAIYGPKKDEKGASGDLGLVGVINEEKCDKFGAVDWKSMSTVLPDPSGIKAVNKIEEDRETIRNAAFTQKLILEEFSANADHRMNRETPWYSPVGVSEGVLPLYKKFCTTLDTLKEDLKRKSDEEKKKLEEVSIT